MNEKNNSELILYQTEDGKTRLEVRFQDETVWLSQQLMADLFQSPNMHIKNIFDDGELDRTATIKDFLIVRCLKACNKLKILDFVKNTSYILLNIPATPLELILRFNAHFGRVFLFIKQTRPRLERHAKFGGYLFFRGDV